MRLQDAIMCAPKLEIQTNDGRIHELPGPMQLHTALEQTPVRYVLDDAVAEMITNAAFDPKNVVAASVDLLRIPAKSLWLEWPTTGPQEAMNSLNLAGAHSAIHTRKVGALISADDSGRRGHMNIAWMNEDGSCDMSPIAIEFDFDDPGFGGELNREACVQKVRINGFDALDPLFDHVRYCLNPVWQKYYQQYECSLTRSLEALHIYNIETIAGDFPFVSAFLMLLGARGALAQDSVTLQKLNKKRIQRGKVPLLDHISVSIALEPDQFAGQISGQGERRAADGVRLHHVNGHLVRRGESVFWRRSHLRGNSNLGVVAQRTIEVVQSRQPVVAVSA